MKSSTTFRKKLGRYDFDGQCKPDNAIWSSQETFSVSIFKWVEAKFGALKKSKSVYRIKGSVRAPELVYFRANQVCDELDKGIFPILKSEKVS